MRLMFAAFALAAASPATATPTDDFKRLLDEHYRWLLRENPVAATRLGVRDYDDHIGDTSAAARDRQAGEAAAFLKRLQFRGHST